MRLAVISAGTNSCRLLIARREIRAPGEDRIEIEHHDLRGTRLGEGVTASGKLSDDAMARTLAAIVEFNRLAIQAERTFVIGTGALRQAANASAFADQVKAKTRLALRVLSGEEEARASFVGAMWSLDRAGIDRLNGACVVDVGGGSTELALSDGRDDAIRGISLTLGAVALTEEFLKSDPPAGSEIAACRTAIRISLANALPALGEKQVLVAVGGSADTAARMLQAYDAIGAGVAKIERADIADLTDLTVSLPLAERKRLRWLPPQRADIFPAGLMILDEIARAAKRDTMIVAESDLLLGYLLLNSP
jgi:exopolyphosphatase / guanosine-5'-triphosphate,3'-diphosphate pyrophosphatase